MTVDLETARADTPGCAEVAHFNNAGAALPPAVVTEAIIDHLRLEARIGGYEAAAARADQLEALYPALARLLGCGADEVAVVDSGTRAWLLAFHSIAWRPGDRVLTARAEYASNYISFLQVARRAGVKVEVIPDDMHGQLSVDALAQMMDDRVRLVAITHVPTNGGLVNPAEEVGAITREAGVTYLLDAVQSVGQMAIDVERLGCDFLAATGRPGTVPDWALRPWMSSNEWNTQEAVRTLAATLLRLNSDRRGEISRLTSLMSTVATKLRRPAMYGGNTSADARSTGKDIIS